MIVPLLKMQIKGALWYQAESNVYPGGENLYACVFPAMIADWRARWNMATNSNFPFFFVQLAAYTQGLNDFTSLPAMRLKQEVATQLVNVGMATAVDLVRSNCDLKSTLICLQVVRRILCRFIDLMGNFNTDFKNHIYVRLY